MRRAILSLLVAGGIFLSACGGGDPEPRLTVRVNGQAAAARGGVRPGPVQVAVEGDRPPGRPVEAALRRALARYPGFTLHRSPDRLTVTATAVLPPAAEIALPAGVTLVTLAQALAVWDGVALRPVPLPVPAGDLAGAWTDGERLLVVEHGGRLWQGRLNGEVLLGPAGQEWSAWAALLPGGRGAAAVTRTGALMQVAPDGAARDLGVAGPILGLAAGRVSARVALLRDGSDGARHLLVVPVLAHDPPAAAEDLGALLHLDLPAPVAVHWSPEEAEFRFGDGPGGFAFSPLSRRMAAAPAGEYSPDGRHVLAQGRMVYPLGGGSVLTLPAGAPWRWGGATWLWRPAGGGTELYDLPGRHLYDGPPGRPLAAWPGGLVVAPGSAPRA